MAGKSPPAHLQMALLTLKFFITDNQKFTQVRNTIHIPLQCNTHRRWVVQPPRKVPEGGPWEGPTPHTNLGWGYGCVSTISRPLLDTKRVHQAIPWTSPFAPQEMWDPTVIMAVGDTKSPEATHSSGISCDLGTTEGPQSEERTDAPAQTLKIPETVLLAMVALSPGR